MFKYGAVCIAGVVLLLCGCQEQKPAQVVALQPSVHKIVLKNPTQKQPTLKAGIPSSIAKNKEYMKWVWPAQGIIISKFKSGSARKGIEISGKEGSAVLSAADGEVVYSGSSLRGYGNLIIVKHNKNFLTAYAHNRKNMVKEGDRVVAGQRIAEMGRTGTDKVKLHFEVRDNGKPVDPQEVLPTR